MKKRDFLKLTSLAAAGTLVAPTLTFCGSSGKTDGQGADSGEPTVFVPFVLPALPYAFDALEPNIDARTMEIHHGKHHAGYTNNLNKALEGRGDLAGKSIDEILSALTGNENDTALRNNGGGYFNHNLFWTVMSPNGGGAPTGVAASAIDSAFGSYDAFKAEFTNAASGVFGSGWAWLCAKDGKVYITSTPNQDNPIMSQIAEKPGTPVLGLDVWEHAYYLNYQNRRADYITGFFNVINWDQVNLYLANG